MPKTLLVVDDEQNVLTYCARVLERAGYEVNTACSGEAALALLQTERHVLLATDIRMPGMSGIELIRHARQLQPELVIVAFTGVLGPDMSSQVMQAGAKGILIKPFKSEELVDAVTFALRDWAAESAPPTDTSIDPTPPPSVGPGKVAGTDSQ